MLDQINLKKYWPKPLAHSADETRHKMRHTGEEIDLPRDVNASTPMLAERWHRMIDFSLARHRALLVFLMLLALELLIFRSYFIGRITPPWDFYGPYNTEAFQWWELGGFFSPREWVSNAWAGYPSALNLQNSAWYLPVGVADALAPFTLHVSAILSALHVAFGSLGTYLLARSFNIRFPIALLAMVAGFFAVGYYSNAQHVDISRGYAWVPWLLLVFAPNFPWRRAWSIPVASLVIWQAATGMYPGMSIAFIYVGLAWVMTYQAITRVRLRDFLVPLTVSCLAAVLLSMPRLLPYAMLGNDVAGHLPESSEFSLAMLGTLVFGYSGAGIVGDISMRSLFVPSTILILAFFASWRHRITKLAIALLLPAIVLGVPGFPWSDAAQELPGLGFSRFGFSDFKVFMVLSLVLLACSGATSLMSFRAQARLSRRTWIPLGCAAIFSCGLILLGIFGPYGDRRFSIALLLVALGIAATWFFPRLRLRLRLPSTFAAVLISVTVVTGSLWAFENPLPWRTDRVAGEVSTFGDTVTNLISKRVRVGETQQRAARVPLPKGATGGGPQNGFSNRYSYLNIDSVASYINLKGSLTQTRLDESLFGPNASPRFADFLAAPGAAITFDSDFATVPAMLATCVEGGTCGPASVTPVSYRPGHMAYNFSSPRELTAIFNEAYYQGWTARACDGAKCRDLSASRSSQGLVSVGVPEGKYIVHLDYVVRGATTGWILFWLGIIVIFATMIWNLIRARNTAFIGERGDVPLSGVLSLYRAGSVI